MPILSLEAPCFITLEKYGAITGISPCAMAGIDPETPYDCGTWDCEKRNHFFNAMQDAARMIEEKRGSLCPLPKIVTSQYDYFNIPNSWLLQTRRELTVVMTVTPPAELADPPCMTMIELVGQVTIHECESVVAARLDLAKCVCPQLPIEWCSADYIETVDPETNDRTLTITLRTRAYNLNLSGDVVSGADLTWLPTEVNITFVVATQVLDARAMWQPKPGCCPATENTCTTRPCCHLQLCCKCVRKTPAGLWEVLDWRRCCMATCCHPTPHHFELDVIVAGAWLPHWAQAIVSLSNNFLPRDFCCSCSAEAKNRYIQDIDLPDNTPAYVFNNPFGIFTPGAKRAWSIISAKSLTVGGTL